MFYHNVRAEGKIETKGITAIQLYDFINEELSCDLDFWMSGNTLRNTFEVEHEYSVFPVETFEDMLRKISGYVKSATIYVHDDRLQFYRRYKYIPALNTWEVASAKVKFVPESYSIIC